MNEQLLEAAKAYSEECYEEELELLRTLGRIPAPSHHEERRAEFVASWLRGIGAPNVQIDHAKNVICLLGDPDARNLYAFAAHTDVVFDDTDELPLSEDDECLYAPGIGDDTANVVGLLFATRFLLDHPEVIPADTGILIVANSCEEGLGNLDGTKALFEAYGSRIREFVSFDLYMPYCVSSAVGSHRFRITVKTQGGHSYHEFGKPNAIAELCTLVCDLYKIMTPDSETTFNVGRIEGGTSVNSIAAEASMLYEYRSTTEESLGTMSAILERVISRHRSNDVSVEVETLGIRPGNGPVDKERQEAFTARNLEILRAVTGEEPGAGAASTDANIPLSLGIPANAVGSVRGALLHTREEWIEKESLKQGLQVILRCMLSSW